MEIKKAIITAASPKQRTLPLQTLVDRDRGTKTALRILVEEVLKAGIEDICIVIHPGDERAYRAAVADHQNRITFVEQKSPRGYGDAIYSAHVFAGKEPLLLLVGDHLYVSREEKSFAEQLVSVARAESCSVSAVQATHESNLPYYGAVGGKLITGERPLYEIDNVIEKPTPTEAEQELIVPGLRAAYYLCFFGMHVLTPLVMDLLADELSTNKPEPFTRALVRLARSERYLACEMRGRRFDIGARYGLLIAQLGLALEGDDRDEVLSKLVELLAARR